MDYCTLKLVEAPAAVATLDMVLQKNGRNALFSVPTHGENQKQVTFIRAGTE